MCSFSIYVLPVYQRKLMGDLGLVSTENFQIFQSAEIPQRKLWEILTEFLGGAGMLPKIFQLKFR